MSKMSGEVSVKSKDNWQGYMENRRLQAIRLSLYFHSLDPEGSVQSAESSNKAEEQGNQSKQEMAAPPDNRSVYLKETEQTAEFSTEIEDEENRPKLKNFLPLRGSQPLQSNAGKDCCESESESNVRSNQSFLASKNQVGSHVAEPQNVSRLMKRKLDSGVVAHDGMTKKKSKNVNIGKVKTSRPERGSKGGASRRRRIRKSSFTDGETALVTGIKGALVAKDAEPTAARLSGCMNNLGTSAKSKLEKQGKERGDRQIEPRENLRHDTAEISSFQSETSPRNLHADDLTEAEKKCGENWAAQYEKVVHESVEILSAAPLLRNDLKLRFEEKILESADCKNLLPKSVLKTVLGKVHKKRTRFMEKLHVDKQLRHMLNKHASDHMAKDPCTSEFWAASRSINFCPPEECPVSLYASSHQYAAYHLVSSNILRVVEKKKELTDTLRRVNQLERMTHEIRKSIMKDGSAGLRKDAVGKMVGEVRANIHELITGLQEH